MTDEIELTTWPNHPKDFEVSKKKEATFGFAKESGKYRFYLDDGKDQISVLYNSSEYRKILDLLKKGL